MTLTREQEQAWAAELSSAKAEASRLFEQRRVLVEIIRRLGAAAPDAREAIIAEALTAAASCQ